MKRLILGLLLLAAITMIGCSSGTTSGGNITPPTASYGNAKLTLTWPRQTRAIGEIAKLHLTVTATGMETVTQDLPVSLTAPSASTIVIVPAGNGRIFTVQAMDTNDATIYSGSTTSNIVAKQETIVTVTLSPVPTGVNVNVNVHTGQPTLTITDLPSISSGKTVLSGKIGGGVNPADLAVTVYINVPGQGWWGPKPYWASPLTIPLSDGSWATSFATGGNDASAIVVMAFLVWKSASPPARSGGSAVPSVPGALCSATGIRAP